MARGALPLTHENSSAQGLCNQEAKRLGGRFCAKKCAICVKVATEFPLTSPTWKSVSSSAMQIAAYLSFDFEDHLQRSFRGRRLESSRIFAIHWIRLASSAQSFWRSAFFLELIAALSSQTPAQRDLGALRTGSHPGHACHRPSSRSGDRVRSD